MAKEGEEGKKKLKRRLYKGNSPTFEAGWNWGGGQPGEAAPAPLEQNVSDSCGNKNQML